jgi:hypothetical protein
MKLGDNWESIGGGFARFKTDGGWIYFYRSAPDFQFVPDSRVLDWDEVKDDLEEPKKKFVIPQEPGPFLRCGCWACKAGLYDSCRLRIYD